MRGDHEMEALVRAYVALLNTCSNMHADMIQRGSDAMDIDQPQMRACVSLCTIVSVSSWRSYCIRMSTVSLDLNMCGLAKSQ